MYPKTCPNGRTEYTPNIDPNSTGIYPKSGALLCSNPLKPRFRVCSDLSTFTCHLFKRTCQLYPRYRPIPIA